MCDEQGSVRCTVGERRVHDVRWARRAAVVIHIVYVADVFALGGLAQPPVRVVAVRVVAAAIRFGWTVVRVVVVAVAVRWAAIAFGWAAVAFGWAAVAVRWAAVRRAAFGWTAVVAVVRLFAVTVVPVRRAAVADRWTAFGWTAVAVRRAAFGWASVVAVVRLFAVAVVPVIITRLLALFWIRALGLARFRVVRAVWLALGLLIRERNVARHF